MKEVFESVMSAVIALVFVLVLAAILSACGSTPGNAPVSVVCPAPQVVPEEKRSEECTTIVRPAFDEKKHFIGLEKTTVCKEVQG